MHNCCTWAVEGKIVSITWAYTVSCWWWIMLLMLWMVPLHFLWSVDSTKYISRRSQFLLNFNLQQLSQRTLVYVDPRGYLEGCVPMQQHFRVQILVSSGTFLMSFAFVMTSCYMKNFGWCMVFSFQLFCIAEEDTILAKWEQFAAACLVFVVRRAALVLARFSPFFSFPQSCASPSVPGPVESRRKELWSSRDYTALALNCRVE